MRGAGQNHEGTVDIVCRFACLCVDQERVVARKSDADAILVGGDRTTAGGQAIDPCDDVGRCASFGYFNSIFAVSKKIFAGER